eukprot:scaffold17827_cov69-Phaeocystis_antarctica.AAC.3
MPRVAADLGTSALQDAECADAAKARFAELAVGAGTRERLNHSEDTLRSLTSLRSCADVLVQCQSEQIHYSLMKVAIRSRQAAACEFAKRVEQRQCLRCWSAQLSLESCHDPCWEIRLGIGSSAEVQQLLLRERPQRWRRHDPAKQELRARPVGEGTTGRFGCACNGPKMVHASRTTSLNSRCSSNQ